MSAQSTHPPLNHGISTRENGERREGGKEEVRLPHLVRRPAKGESRPAHKVVPHLCQAFLLSFNLILRSGCTQRPTLFAKVSRALKDDALHLLICTAEQLQRSGANQIKVR